MLTVRGNIKVTGNLNLKTALTSAPAGLVTDGLAFYVDAGDTDSYPGSGTTWTDISTNSNNGTLTNGPTFDSGDGGSIVFDGTDDYIELGSIDSSNAISLAGTTGQTWEAWINADGTGDQYQRIFDKSNSGGGTNGHFLSLGYDSNDGEIYCKVNNNTSDMPNGVYGENMYTTGSWAHICVTRKNNTADAGWNFYSNAVVKLSRSSTNLTVPTTTTNAKIGTWSGTAREWNGKIAIVRLYNRDLSAAEVLQNYNAEKSRYGL
jgi:hypothetical protein